jgi:DinB superfamily
MIVTEKILETVEKESLALNALSEEKFSYKPSQATWSPKEIIGHLVDSAQNNMQRFVRGQYEDKPHIVYTQDEWVRLQAYQQADKNELIQLWVLFNRQLCRTLNNMDTAKYGRLCDWGKTSPEFQTLSYIAEDYYRHMIHHLNQLKQRILIPESSHGQKA